MTPEELATDRRFIKTARNFEPTKNETILLDMLSAVLDEVERLEAENASLREEIDHAIAQAKEREPEYPWTQNTASEAVWALGEGLRGIRMANDELHASNAALRADLERVWPAPIPCAERLPEPGVEVLVWCGHRWIMSYRLGNHWAEGGLRSEGALLADGYITHWLPLPPVGGEK